MEKYISMFNIQWWNFFTLKEKEEEQVESNANVGSHWLLKSSRLTEAMLMLGHTDYWRAAVLLKQCSCWVTLTTEEQPSYWSNANVGSHRLLKSSRLTEAMLMLGHTDYWRAAVLLKQCSCWVTLTTDEQPSYWSNAHVGSHWLLKSSRLTEAMLMLGHTDYWRAAVLLKQC